MPVKLEERDSLIKAATTSLSSKVLSQYSQVFAPMAVDAVLKVLDPQRANLLDLRDIKVQSIHLSHSAAQRDPAGVAAAAAVSPPLPLLPQLLWETTAPGEYSAAPCRAAPRRAMPHSSPPRLCAWRHQPPRPWGSPALKQSTDPNPTPTARPALPNLTHCPAPPAAPLLAPACHPHNITQYTQHHTINHLPTNQIVSKVGGTVDDSELIDGLVFDQKASKAAGGPSRMEKAKIALIQFCVSPPKTDLENQVVVSDYTQVISKATPFMTDMSAISVIHTSGPS